MTYSRPRRFLLALMVAGLLHSRLSGATPEPGFTWRDLTDGTITHTVTNSGATSEKWTATVVPLAAQVQGPPQLVVEPQSRDAVPPSTSVEFRLRLEPNARPVLGSSFRYLLTVERTNGVQTTRERAIIRIGPVISLVPQSPTAKYVLTATRPIPFLYPWEIRAPLRLAEAPHPDRLKEAENRPLGVLYVGSQAAASLDHSAVIRWAPNVTADRQVIPLGLDFPRWSSAKLTGTLSFPDGQTRDVVVQTSDFVAYPLLVIIAGVSVAYKVKRYVTRDRALLVLRATLADTEARLTLADAEFPRTSVDKSIAGFDILAAWSKFRTEIEADIQSLQLTTGALDQTNAAFTTLSTKIMSSRKLPADWTAFGTNLRALDTLREGIAEIDPPTPLNGRPSIEEALAAAERGEPLPTVDTLVTLATRITALIAAAQSWRAAWDRSIKLAAVQNNPATAEIDQAQRTLWLRFDEPAFAEVKQLLDRATAGIVKAGGAAPAQRETVRSPEQQPPVAVPEALKIQRDDRLTVLVALGLAVLVGLNAEYFGKPFGSVGDYARVLAWALSATIGVDLASLALGRIGSTLASSRVTRA